MKTVIHAQTAPFEFIGFEYEETEVLSSGRIAIAINDFKRVSGAIKGVDIEPAGLDTKTWNKCLDEYNKTGTLTDGTNLYEEMNNKQKFYFQEQKKSLKRIKAID